jgi:hypothetical protein
VAAIDVLLPVRNGLPFLREAIESIRDQTFSDWRLLVLDHGSADGSAALARDYEERDPRIKLFSFPGADGLAGLLNAGLEKCDCKYVLRQDADDISLPTRMSAIVDRFRDNPDFLVIGSNAVTIDEAGREIGSVELPSSHEAIAAAGFFYNPMRHPTIAINFASFTRHGAAYGRDFLNAAAEKDLVGVKGLAEDYFLFGQLALIGPCINLRAPLIKYRLHGGSVCVTNTEPQMQLALRISRFLAKSFCAMKGLPEFDPAPFCNHGENVFDFQRADYTDAFEPLAFALRRGLGPSPDVERELAFRWILATRNSFLMTARALQFQTKYGSTASEKRTVRNWLIRGMRGGKYVYRVDAGAPAIGVMK